MSVALAGQAKPDLIAGLIAREPALPEDMNAFTPGSVALVSTNSPPVAL